MKKLNKELLNKRAFKDNANNVNNSYLNNDINVNRDISKYRLDKTKFTPNSEKTQLAEQISKELNDPHYAGFLSLVNKIGCSEARRLLASVKQDIKDKRDTKTPVRNSGKYFWWKYKNSLY